MDRTTDISKKLIPTECGGLGGRSPPRYQSRRESAAEVSRTTRSQKATRGTRFLRRCPGEMVWRGRKRSRHQGQDIAGLLPGAGVTLTRPIMPSHPGRHRVQCDARAENKTGRAVTSTPAKAAAWRTTQLALLQIRALQLHPVHGPQSVFPSDWKPQLRIIPARGAGSDIRLGNQPSDG